MANGGHPKPQPKPEGGQKPAAEQGTKSQAKARPQR